MARNARSLALAGVLTLAASTPPTALASPFYKFDVVGRTGQANADGAALTAIEREVALNDSGLVAFTGSVAAGESVYVGDGSAAPRIVSFATPSTTRDYRAGVQITNGGQVVSNDRSGSTDTLRLWDANSPGNFVTVVRGSLTGGTVAFPAPFDAVFSHPSASNANGVVFSGIDSTFPGTGTVVATPKALGDNNTLSDFNVASLATPLRPMIADDGAVIVRAGNLATDPIRLYQNDLSPATAQVVADAGAGFTSLGRSPGISDDGAVVAFAGDRGNGQGIFLRFTSGGLGPVFRVAGENGGTPTAELGYDDGASAINIAAIDLDQRVGVARLSLGAAGFAEDVLYVTFVGTPSGASRDNPALPGVQPLLFSASKGLWTVRIDLDAPLDGSGGSAFHLNSPLPVVQVGDRIPSPAGECQVSDLGLYDPVAVAARDDGGAVRTQRRGDHRVAFWASCAGGGAMVVRASHIDSDQDGLLDHWEQAGGGIDVDQDGTVDLDLSAFGATPGARDVLLEVDWTSARLSGSPQPYRLEPPPGATKFLADMFAAAPVLSGARYGVRTDGLPPADIPAGITARIDAGPGTDTLGAAFSRNIAATAPPLQGGDVVTTGGDHIDVVHFGAAAVAVPGLRTRALQDIKDTFFGTADRRARELAFHYVMLADFYQLLGDNDGDGDVAGNEGNNSAPLIGAVAAATVNTLTAVGTPFDTASGVRGHAVLLTQGTGAGQVRRIVANNASVLQIAGTWATMPDPTSQFVLLSGSSGRAEVEFRADASSRPGNDHVVTLGGFTVTVGPPNFPGSPFEHGQTLAHELGHTLGLRHGGVDHQTSSNPASASYKPSYQSLMNYAYQLANPNPTTGLTVRDYSRPGDLVFVDWDNLRLDPFNSLHHVGNSFALNAAGAPAADDPQVELNELEVEEAFGPLDRTLPTVAIDLPAPGALVPTSSALIVELTASDDTGVHEVTVSFDLDGDGTTEDADEVQTAAPLGGNRYRATFPAALAGPEGVRAVRGVARDRWLHAGLAEVTLNVTSAVPIVVPDVVGLTQPAAEAAITAAGLTVTGVVTVSDPVVPAGQVISQVPSAGSAVAPGSGVSLTVSTGPAAPLRGDVDGDGDVDSGDVALVTAVLNTPAAGPDDPRDLNADGTISVRDARLVVLECTRPRCATHD
jgi:hypothetical protein